MASDLPLSAAQEPIHAAEYLRKSAEHQKYSIENQADATGCMPLREACRLFLPMPTKKAVCSLIGGMDCGN